MQLILGNCLEKMKDLSNESVDLVLTDPPYLINYQDWDHHLFQSSKDFDDFTESYIKESFRILKPTGTFWGFMGYQNIFPFFKILEKYGYPHYENWVIWVRQKGRGASKHLISQREDIIHVTKNKKDFTWNSLKMLREVVIPYVKNGVPRGWFLNEEGKRVRWTGLGNVWTYSSPQWNGKTHNKQVHPSQKPVLMLERIILLSTHKGDVVFDPFMGSGSTGVACVMTERNFIGIENNETFFNAAKKRIEDAQDRQLNTTPSLFAK